MKQIIRHSGRNLFAALAILVVGLMQSVHAVAEDVKLQLVGDVTEVQNPISGDTTTGITTDDFLGGYLVYDDTTAQVQGDLRHYQLLELLIDVPDTSQAGGSFLIAPPLNTSTRAVFDDATDEFVGIHLPNNPGPRDAFGLTDVDLQVTSLTLGNKFSFRKTTPVVEGIWQVSVFEETVPIPFFALVALAFGLLFLGGKRLS